MITNQRALAELFAEQLEDYIGDSYAEIIDDLNTDDESKQFLREKVRWTLVNEETGENLLDDVRANEPPASYRLAIERFLATFRDQIENDQEMNGADTMDQVASLYRQFKGLVKP